MVVSGKPSIINTKSLLLTRETLDLAELQMDLTHLATRAPHIVCDQCLLSLTTCLQMSAPKNQTTSWPCSSQVQKVLERILICSWSLLWRNFNSYIWRGVLTRDLYSSPLADFFLCVVITWCIHDYPTLGTMSGRTPHGYNAVVRWDKNQLSYAILSKIGYIGHHRFLAKDKPHPRKY